MTKDRNVRRRTKGKYGLDTKNENYYLNDQIAMTYSTKKNKDGKSTLASLATNPLVPIVISAGIGLGKFIYNKIKSRKKAKEDLQISPKSQVPQQTPRQYDPSNDPDVIYGGYYASPLMTN